MTEPAEDAADYWAKTDAQAAQERENYDRITTQAGREIILSRDMYCPFSSTLGGRVFLRQASHQNLRQDTWTLVTMDHVLRLTYVVDTETDLPTRGVSPSMTVHTLAGVLVADIRSEELGPSEEHDPEPVILKLAIAFDLI